MTEQPPGPPPGSYPPPPPPQGGGVPPPPGYGSQPDNNLVWAILVTVFCCTGNPLGIVSIVKASQVSGLWAGGRYAEAQKAADDARKFAMWGAIAGAVLIVGYFLFWLIFSVLLVDSVHSNIPTSFTPTYPT